MSEQATCRTCRWFDEYPPANSIDGVCRKTLPTVLLDADGNRNTLWPRTHGNDWCGEHTPKGGMVSGRDARRAKAKKRATVLVCKRIDGVEPIPSGWRDVALVDAMTGTWRILAPVMVAYE